MPQRSSFCEFLDHSSTHVDRGKIMPCWWCLPSNEVAQHVKHRSWSFHEALYTPVDSKKLAEDLASIPSAKQPHACRLATIFCNGPICCRLPHFSHFHRKKLQEKWKSHSFIGGFPAFFPGVFLQAGPALAVVALQGSVRALAVGPSLVAPGGLFENSSPSLREASEA